MGTLYNAREEQNAVTLHILNNDNVPEEHWLRMFDEVLAELELKPTFIQHRTDKSFIRFRNTAEQKLFTIMFADRRKSS